MDFQALKLKALKFKDDVIDKSAKKLAGSSMVLNTVEELDAFIEKSKTKKVTIKDTWEEKEFIKKVIVIFADNESDFFEKSLIQLPVLVTKAFSQNIPLKMCDVALKDLKKYWVESHPTLLVYETEKVIKTIDSEEGISSIVKDLSLDINAAIESL